MTLALRYRIASAFLAGVTALSTLPGITTATYAATSSTDSIEPGTITLVRTADITENDVVMYTTDSESSRSPGKRESVDAVLSYNETEYYLSNYDTTLDDTEEWSAVTWTVSGTEEQQSYLIAELGDETSYLGPISIPYQTDVAPDESYTGRYEENDGIYSYYDVTFAYDGNTLSFAPMDTSVISFSEEESGSIFDILDNITLVGTATFENTDASNMTLDESVLEDLESIAAIDDNMEWVETEEEDTTDVATNLLDTFPSDVTRTASLGTASSTKATITREGWTTFGTGYKTGLYFASYGGKRYRAYCAWAKKSGLVGTANVWTSTFNASNPTSDSNVLLAALLLAPGSNYNANNLYSSLGYDYAGLSSTYGRKTLNQRYGYYHALMSWIAKEDKKGMSSDCLKWVLAAYSKIKADLADTSSTLYKYTAASKLYIAAKSASDNTDYQWIVWVEPKTPSTSITVRKITGGNQYVNGIAKCTIGVFSFATESDKYWSDNYTTQSAKYGVYTSADLDTNTVDKDTLVASFRTNSLYTGNDSNLTGSSYTTLTLDPGTYYIQEISAPKGYKLSDKVQKFTITSGTDTDIKNYDYPLQTQIVVSKTDSVTGATLEGVEFTLYTDSSCTTIAKTAIPVTLDDGTTGYKSCVVKTDENGYAVFGNLALGVYYLKETKGVDGYVADTTTVTKIDMSNTYCNLSFVYDYTGISQTVNGYNLTSKATQNYINANGYFTTVLQQLSDDVLTAYKSDRYVFLADVTSENGETNTYEFSYNENSSTLVATTQFTDFEACWKANYFDISVYVYDQTEQQSTALWSGRYDIASIYQTEQVQAVLTATHVSANDANMYASLSALNTYLVKKTNTPKPEYSYTSYDSNYTETVTINKTCDGAEKEAVVGAQFTITDDCCGTTKTVTIGNDGTASATFTYDYIYSSSYKYLVSPTWANASSSIKTLVDQEGAYHSYDEAYAAAVAEVMNKIAAKSHTYTITETYTPSGYVTASSVSQTVYGGWQTSTFNVTDAHQWGQVELTKVAENTTVSRDESYYSLEGAVYYIYTDKNCKTRAVDKDGNYATITTNKDGYGISSYLSVPKTYYIKEATPSKGYNLDTTVYTANISPSNHTQVYWTVEASSAEPVQTGYLALTKSSANTSITDGNDCYSLAGAVYYVYTDASCTTLAKDVHGCDVILETDANGVAHLKNSMSAHSDDAKNTTVEVGMGTYYAKEVTASPGYYLCSETQIDNPTTMAADSVHMVTVSKENETATFTCEEVPTDDPFQLTLTKMDSVSGSLPTGTASLEGAVFQITYYDNVNGETANSDLTRTWYFTTDENGQFNLEGGVGYLASGSYTVQDGTSTKTVT